MFVFIGIICVFGNVTLGYSLKVKQRDRCHVIYLLYVEFTSTFSCFFVNNSAHHIIAIHKYHVLIFCIFARMPKKLKIEIIRLIYYAFLFNILKVKILARDAQTPIKCIIYCFKIGCHIHCQYIHSIVRNTMVIDMKNFQIWRIELSWNITHIKLHYTLSVY